MEPASKTFTDNCNIKGEDLFAPIRKELDADEQIVFSCVVQKRNKWGMNQDRQMMLSNKRLYNIATETSMGGFGGTTAKIQRKINVSTISAISRSTAPDCAEFVVHVTNEYDYQFESSIRDEIFDALRYTWWKVHGSNVPEYAVPSSLENLHTTKQDSQVGRVVVPNEHFLVQDKPYPETGGQTTAPKLSDRLSGYDNSNQMDMAATNKEITQAKGRTMTLYQRHKAESGKEPVLEDFAAKTVIGRGAFGKVYLVQQQGTSNVFAMKTLRKDMILDYDQVEATKLEKEVLQKANHPFLVGMEYVFSTEFKLYFVMKFIRGGELFEHLRRQKKFPEKRAKFYAMTVALGLGHLHSQHIIYRDLKPENILMGEDGYLCMTDFGCAKMLDNQSESTTTFVGTPEYMSPELLQGKGYSYPADWWALGVLAYEMIVGFPPFASQKQDKMFDMIKKKDPAFPDEQRHGIKMSPECVDFIKQCLCKDPAKRLGSKEGLKEICAHPWFADLSVDDVTQRKITPEFVPKLSKNVLDTQNFDQMFTGEEVKDTALPRAAQRKVMKNAGKFEGFD